MLYKYKKKRKDTLSLVTRKIHFWNFNSIFKKFGTCNIWKKVIFWNHLNEAQGQLRQYLQVTMTFIFLTGTLQEAKDCVISNCARAISIKWDNVGPSWYIRLPCLQVLKKDRRTIEVPWKREKYMTFSYDGRGFPIDSKCALTGFQICVTSKLMIPNLLTIIAIIIHWLDNYNRTVIVLNLYCVPYTSQ